MNRRANRPARRKIGLVIGAVAAAGWLVGSATGLVNRSEVVKEAISQTVRNVAPQQVLKEEEDMTVLILGCDQDYTRGGKRVTRSAARSDMMMVARLGLKDKSIKGVSIPRDLLVKIPGHGRDKINAAHAYGGPDLSREVVEELLGLKVDRVVVLNFEAFKDMIDMLGGVDLDVDRNMRYVDRAAKLDINLKKGEQHLDGEQAMGYVRYRKGDSDFKRQDRQKQLMLSVKDVMIANPAKIPDVADQTVAILGNTFSPAEVAALIRFAKDVPAENIRLGAVPVISHNSSRAYTQSVDADEFREVMEDIGLWEGTGAKEEK